MVAMRKKVIKGVNVFLLVIIVVMCLFGEYIVLFLIFGLEHVYTKWDINNPYVNQRYKGWREICLAGEDKVKIPSEWHMVDDNGVLLLTDHCGELWGVGTAFGTETDVFESYATFASEYTPIQTQDVSIQPLEGFDAINGSEAYILSSDTSECSTVYYCLELHRPNVDYFFIVFADLSKSSDEYNIAEAIVYSFAY